MPFTPVTDRPDTLVSRIESVAARYPAKTAVESDATKLTYSQLLSSANAVAQTLCSGYSVPAGRVALLFDDRVATLIAILGVLKSGHAYVPLDAVDPAARIQFILNDCEPFALIADAAHLTQARQLAPKGCRVIPIDEAIASASSAALPEIRPETLAYIFYTSGSTGHPKGVCQIHRNVLHFADCYRNALRIGAEDRLSLLFSLSFSASNMDIYPGLLSGATLCPYNLRRNGIPSLARWLEREGITVLHAVPTMFRHLAKSLETPHVFDRIRAIDLGGEAIFASDVDLFRRHFPPGCLFVNHLAATEANVIAQYFVDRDESFPGKAVPAGRSPEGLEVRILRPDGTRADLDEVGEIAIHSPFVSPGYWKRPEQNELAFSDDAERPGWRIFRPGDLGRFDPDHNLHFLGRQGTRVKIRGNTIDLVEVEAALRACERVRDAAVIASASDDPQETDRLVAYVVARSIHDRDPKKIRSDLAGRLPLYMLPSVYVFVDDLPLTATGKVDRKALPRPADLPVNRQDRYQPPADELEKGVAEIYQLVLKFSPVGREDDFFLLGGDSMSVVDLQIRLFDAFGKDVPDLFDNSTVAGVAASIRRRESAPPDGDRLMPVLFPLREQGSGPILFLLHGRLGQAHVGPYFLGLLDGDQPLYVFQARGLDGIQPRNESIEAMAKDYLDALRRVQPEGPYLLGALCAGGYVAIEMARRLRAAGERVAPLLLIDPPVPPFSSKKAAKNLKKLDQRLGERQEKGQLEFDINDPVRRKGAIQVVESFENALLNYRLQPYDGPVRLFASSRRLSADGWKSPGRLKMCFSGDLHIFEVGQVHGQIIDVRNDTFTRHFTASLKQARVAMNEDDRVGMQQWRQSRTNQESDQGQAS